MAQLLDFQRDPPPSLANPVSQACTQAQFDTPIYHYWCREIREAPRYHRKQWEFCYILQALAVNGAIAPERRGIGFGVGTEPLTAVLAARGCRILATDLDPGEAEKAGWVATNQHASRIAQLNTRGICDPAVFPENVTFRFLDMNRIPPELGDFDFTWSACCLEHLGSIGHGLAFIENTVALLRPGGIAVHTTEFNCSSNDHTIERGGTVLFRRRDIEALCARLSAAGHEVTLNFNLGDQPLDKHVDVPPYSADDHLKLQIAQYASTSFGLAIRKAAAARQPLPRRLRHRLAPLWRERAPVATDRLGNDILAELAAIKQELAARLLAAAAPATSAVSPHPPPRPYYYLGGGAALTQLSAGHPFLVNTRDRGITSWIILGGVWETFVDDVLCALARPGQVFLDVGANQGYYTVKLGHLVGEKGAVFSFEPNPELYPFLAENVSLNGLSSRVHTYCVAAGDAPGRSELHFNYSNMGGGYVDIPGAATEQKAGVPVEIVRIDDTLPEDTSVDLIKIDAEGFEPLVLRGMRRTLARSPQAAIVIEIAAAHWSRFGDPLQVLEDLRDDRAAYWINHDGRLTSVTSEEIASRLSPDFVSYLLLLPRSPEAMEAIAKFVA